MTVLDGGEERRKSNHRVYSGGHRGSLEQRRDSLLDTIDSANDEIARIARALEALDKDPNVVALIETILNRRI
jgi:hypothetical protein